MSEIHSQKCNLKDIDIGTLRLAGEKSDSILKTHLQLLQTSYSTHLRLNEHINLINWEKFFEDSHYAELILEELEIDNGKFLLDYLIEFYKNIAEKKIGLLNNMCEFYLRKNESGISYALSDKEAEAFARNIMGRIGIHQPHYVSRFAELYQKSWIKLNAESDIAYRPNHTMTKQISSVLTTGINKKTTTNGIDDLVLWHLSDNTVFGRIIVLKSGTGVTRLSERTNPLFRFMHKGDSAYDFKDTNGINTFIQDTLISMLKNPNSPFLELDDFDGSHINFFSEQIMKKYDFEQDGVGSKFWGELQNGSGFKLQYKIRDLIQQGELEKPLAKYMKGIILQSQITELMQNVCTRTIIQNKNGHWIATDEYKIEIEPKIKVEGVQTPTKFRINGLSFIPNGFSKITNDSLVFTLNGFDLSSYTLDSDQYIVARYLNDLIRTVCESCSFPLNKGCTFLDKPNEFIKILSEIQRRMLTELISFIPEITEIWGKNGLEFSLSTLTEDTSFFVNYMIDVLNRWSVAPYKIIQHWNHPTFGSLYSFYSRCASRLSGDFADLQHNAFRLVSDGLPKKSINKSPTNPEFLANILDDYYKLGIYIMKTRVEPFSLPKPANWGGYTSNIALTFCNTNNELIKIRGYGGHAAGLTLFYRVDFSEWVSKGYTLDDLRLPFMKPRWEKSIAIRFTDNPLLVDYWKKLLKSVNIPNSILNRLNTQTTMSGDATMFSLMIVILRKYRQNWDEFAEMMWSGIKSINPSIIDKCEDVIFRDNVFYFKDPITGILSEVRLVISKLYKKNSPNSGFEIRSSHYIPFSESFFGKYIKQLELELFNLLQKNTPDAGSIRKWIPGWKHLNLKNEESSNKRWNSLFIPETHILSDAHKKRQNC